MEMPGVSLFLFFFHGRRSLLGLGESKWEAVGFIIFFLIDSYLLC